MFWKNAKTLKYEYIQRGRDVVSAPGFLQKISTVSVGVCMCVFVAMMEAVGAAAHFSALFPSFPPLYRTQNETLRGLFKLMSGVRALYFHEIRVNAPSHSCRLILILSARPHFKTLNWSRGRPRNCLKSANYRVNFSNYTPDGNN